RCNVTLPTNSIRRVEDTILVKADPAQEGLSNRWFEQAKRLLAISSTRGLTLAEKAVLNAYLQKARMAANDVRMLNENSTSVS
ncbi:hypothetical protein ACI3PL_27760, partial [Lacticaseibacillus paracasei]